MKAGTKNIVIVESPTKAGTIQGFLGKGFEVVATFGHIRDLPQRKLGVDLESFEPEYVTPTKKRQLVAGLKKKVKQASQIFIATDEDREGEAIGWHALELLGLDLKQAKRVAFHEITSRAVKEAFEHPRSIDLNLVNAQQARRVLDRLVGYTLSPLLWKKILRGLSAGRVQSAALRLIVERERAILSFKPEEYWTLKAVLENKAGVEFEAELSRLADKKASLKSEAQVKATTGELEAQEFAVKTFKEQTKELGPYPPFTTSTLQQAASAVLRFSVKRTMQVAQSLYEGVAIDGKRTGLITYMRTDSPALAPLAISELRVFIGKEFGQKYLNRTSRQFAAKSKSAQEAHEAIRPTHPHFLPQAIQSLTPDQRKLYQLIWQRAVATQMAPLAIAGREAVLQASQAEFVARGTKIIFDGFAKVAPRKIEEIKIPQLSPGEKVKLIKFLPAQHFTEPPARFSEGTLVKELERLGIGRPSTYAPIISTIVQRNYVRPEKRQLAPQEVGFLVSDFLLSYFPEIVDYQFTAQMEDKLDEIAQGKIESRSLLREFYRPFAAKVAQTEEQSSKLMAEPLDEKCPRCGHALQIKLGRFGKFIACSNFPACHYTRPLEENQEVKTVAIPCPHCGAPMAIRSGKFGQFLGCSRYPDCKTILDLRDATFKEKCPQCREGQLVLRKDKRRRKLFYGCSRFPECQFASWDAPVGPCPTCRGPMVLSSKKHPICLNCGYEEKGEEA